MKIAILSPGRFHVLDYGRELRALGHEVTFYSQLPPGRVERFGFPSSAYRSLLRYSAPSLALTHLASRFHFHEDWVGTLNRAQLDHAAARLLEPCDVLISMSGFANLTGQVARDRYGARIIIERGSKHILEQRRVLKVLGAPGPSDEAVRRELFDYEQADVVVVPAHHAVRSFAERGFPSARLRRNPYGVSLDMFPPTARKGDSTPTVIMVGSWCKRKGCHILSEAVRRLRGVRLLHVGGIADAPVPTESWFVHVDPVDQPRLTEYYAQADVAALASFEEGLALVQAQALASGLPLVCTPDTGGEDLAQLLGGDGAVSVVPSGATDALAAAIALRLDERGTTGQLRTPPGPTSELGWRRTMERYEANVLAPLCE